MYKKKFPQLASRAGEAKQATDPHAPSGAPLSHQDEKILSDLEKFSASSRWLQGFFKRFNLKSVCLSGEAASVSEAEVLASREQVKSVLASFLLKGLKQEDIFNMDETGLCFRLAPRRGIVSSLVREGKGVKKARERVTIALCCNADGSEKYPILAIGQSKKPRSFRDFPSLKPPCDYESNKRAWMTAEIFHHWIIKFDGSRTRPTLLLVDNFSGHKVPLAELKNTTVIFLVPNTTAHLQPLDGGIIASVKARFRRLQLEEALRVVTSDLVSCWGERH